MKILPLSDLHLDFATEGEDVYIPKLSPEDKDTVVVLSGDIHTGVKAIDWIGSWCGQVEAVVYVPGNREYYGHKFPTLDIEIEREIEDRCLSNVHFLNNRSIVIDGTRFIGSTLWTCFDNQDPFSIHRAKQVMNDYRKITYQLGDMYSSLHPVNITSQHVKSRMFIEEELSNDFDGNTVVVTHHLPSWVFLGKKYTGNALNGAYAAHLDALIGKHQDNIDLWVFGHNHNASIFNESPWEVLFVQNCRGYAGHALVENFSDTLRIEL